MKKNKYIVKITAGALSALLVVTATVPAFAATTASEKEEVVYVMTDASGAVSDVEVVNIFAGGDIIDYGNYTAVKMLTTNDTISQNQDVITFSTDAEKVYYQGTLEDAQIPWNISITYSLDGKEVSAEELSGASGKLEIHLVITENTKCSGDFYNNYALQASFTLDRDLCKNINASDGTMANVGNDKQITYTILPGKGIDTVLSADVTDFTMDAAAINGIRMNLNIEVDDTELMDKVSQIMDASEKLNDGATSVADGTDTLKSGAETLNDGAASLESGANSLDEGITSLQTGIANMQTGLNTLNSKSSTLTDGSAQMLTALGKLQSSLGGASVTTDQLTKLTASSAAIKTGIDTLQANLGYAQYQALMKGKGCDITALQTGNSAAISNLNAKINATTDETEKAYLKNLQDLLTGSSAAISGTEAYLNTLSSSVSTLKTNYAEFDTAINTLAGTLTNLAANMTTLQTGVNEIVTNYKTLNTGITDYTDGVATIVAGYQQMVDGVASLSSGSKELLDGASTLSTGTQDLYDGASTLADGTIELSDGTSEFYDKTADMDTQVQDQIDDILSSVQGNDSEIVSFVSDKNSNVDSVQFVIKTAAIEIPEVDATEETETVKLSFWQKFLNLFS